VWGNTNTKGGRNRQFFGFLNDSHVARASSTITGWVGTYDKEPHHI
jgi:hypothetical protein